MIKKMEMKKIAAFMMALAIVSSPMVNADLPQLIPEISVSAATVVGNFSVDWNESEKTLTIAAAQDSSNSLSLETSNIDNIFSKNEFVYVQRHNVVTIIVGDGISSIGDSAFSEFNNLKTVKLSSSVTSIGDSAFAGLKELKKVEIAGTGVKIGASAFSGCKVLNSVSSKGGVVNLSNVTEMGAGAFSGCTEITSVNFGDSYLETIPEGAFCNCDFLETVKLSSKTTAIAGSDKYTTGAFANCPKLKTIDLGGVTSIGKNAFNGSISDNSITSVTLNLSKVTNIGDYAFQKCSKLTGEIKLSSLVEKGLGGEAFAGTGITSVTFDENKSLTTISDEAFISCEELTSVTLSDSINKIEQYAFYGCTALTSVGSKSTTGVDLSNVTEIGKNAFSGCTGITSVDFGSSTLIEIPAGAFNGCAELAEVTLSSSTTTIADGTDTTGAFANCPKLKEIDLNNVTSIGKYAFYGSLKPTDDSSKSIDVDLTLSSVATLGEYAFAGAGITSVDFTGSTLTAIPASAFNGCAELAEVTLSSETTTIADGTDTTGVFANCPKLKTINLGGVTSIGDYAFSNSISDRSITDGVKLDLSGVQSIGAGAFGGCSKLTGTINLGAVGANGLGEGAFVSTGITSVTFEGNESLTEIPAIAFSCCSSLTTVTLSENIKTISSGDFAGAGAFACCTKLSSIDLGGVTSIGDYAFYNSIHLPNTTDGTTPSPSVNLDLSKVQSIGMYAFQYSTNLKTVGLESNAALTTIGTGAFSGCTGVTEIVIPSSVETVGGSAFGSWKDTQTIIVNKLASELAITGTNATVRYAQPVVFNLSNMETDDTDVKIYYGQANTITLKINSGCTFSSITVTSGDTILTSGTDYTFNSGTGELKITKTDITEKVTVTASAYKRNTVVSTPAAIVLVTPKAISNLTYNGKAQTLITQGTVHGGTLMYSVNGGDWQDTLPTAKNAGTYTIEYYVKGNPGYKDSAVSSLTVKIAAAETVDTTIRNLRATAKDSTISVNWTAVTGAEQYKAYIYDSNGNLKGSKAVNTNSASFTSEKLFLTGGTYTITVWAVVDGVAQEKSSVTVTMPVDTTIKNLTATAKDSTISVNWTSVTGADQYKAYVYDSNGNLKASKAVTANSASFSSAKLFLPGQTYTVTVWAVVDGTAQEKSSTTVTMPETEEVAAVTNVKASAVTGYVTASWDAVAGATKYAVYYYNESGTRLASKSVTGTSYTTSFMKTVITGETITVAVRATLADGTVTEFTKTTAVVGIGTPENLTAAKSDTTVTAEWTALAGVDGYAVYFRNADGKLLGSKAVTTNSVTSTSTKYNTDVYVQVKAYTLDENGNKVYGSFCELVKAQ